MLIGFNPFLTQLVAHHRYADLIHVFFRYQVVSLKETILGFLAGN
jgi:hypothetical protein